MDCVKCKQKTDDGIQCESCDSSMHRKCGRKYAGNFLCKKCLKNARFETTMSSGF